MGSARQNILDTPDVVLIHRCNQFSLVIVFQESEQRTRVGAQHQEDRRNYVESGHSISLNRLTEAIDIESMGHDDEWASSHEAILHNH